MYFCVCLVDNLETNNNHLFDFFMKEKHLCKEYGPNKEDWRVDIYLFTVT